jgi:hypothetical protein
LPFLPLFDGVPNTFSAPLPNSRGFAVSYNVTLRVMGGKGGKIAATIWQQVARSAAKTARFEGM